MYGLHYYYVMIDFKDYIMSYKMVCKWQLKAII